MSNQDREYGIPHLELTPLDATLNTQIQSVTDVPGEFDRILKKGDLLAVQEGEIFKRPREFRYVYVSRTGLTQARNHFQGIQRLRKGQYFVFSGADITEPVSHLFVGRMETRRARGPWGSNLLFSARPKDRDRIVKVIPLDIHCWHAGGVSVLGDILAVPIEGNNMSKILFLHLFDPENPTRLACEINRPNIAKAGAVALSRLSSGKFVCAVWREVKRKPLGRLDFYISKTENLQDGFIEKPDGDDNECMAITWNWGDLNLNEPHNPKYQSVNFVCPSSSDAGDGMTLLYLIGTENDDPKVPIARGADYADLYEVLIPNDMFTNQEKIPILKRLQRKQFFPNREYCNFSAAAGIHVGSKCKLSLYGGYYYRVGDTIKFMEFRSLPDQKSEIQDIQDAWIDLYEEPNCGGRRLSVVGMRESMIPDYSKLFVQGGGFNDKVSSVKYQIPHRYKYRLYKDKAFVGHQAGEDFIDLKGKGKIERILDFKSTFRNFDNKVSSSRYIEES
ncbi:MAG: hypothetical protein ACETWK_06430 [Candidatus Aminicenantaceae bacterium]